MSLVSSSKLSVVDLDFTVNGTDTISKPFYLQSIDVKHNISKRPIYYIDGSFISRYRRVYFQPISNGGVLRLSGFFLDTDNQTDVYNSLTNSETINPTDLSTTIADTDIRLNGKKYVDAHCDSVSLKAASLGDGVNIILGTIGFLFDEVEDYP